MVEVKVKNMDQCYSKQYINYYNYNIQIIKSLRSSLILITKIVIIFKDNYFNNHYSNTSKIFI